MRLATIALGILVTGAVVYCIYYYRVELGLVKPQTQSQPQAFAAPPPSNPVSPKAPPIAWQTINRPADGFKIDMPLGITETRLPAYSTHGASEPVETIEASPEPGATFALSWADNPPVERASRANAQRTLDLALNGVLVRTQTTLINQSQTTFSGYQAREFTARGDGGVLNARLILAGKRLFMLLAALPSSRASQDDDVSRFFNSFVLSAPPCVN